MSKEIKLIHLLLISLTLPLLIGAFLYFFGVERLKRERDNAIKFRECLMSNEMDENCENMIAAERFGRVINKQYSK